MERLDCWWTKTSPERRVDFNLGNLCMLLGLMIPSLSIVLRGPIEVSVVNDMPEWLQVGMCALIFVGCGMKLHGAIGGRRFYFPNMSLKRCYRWGYTGAPLATIGSFVYGYYLVSGLNDFWSAMGSISTPIFGIGVSAQAVIYRLEVRRIERNEAVLTESRKSAKQEERHED
jgi:hypothetical protein